MPRLLYSLAASDATRFQAVDAAITASICDAGDRIAAVFLSPHAAPSHFPGMQTSNPVPIDGKLWLNLGQNCAEARRLVCPQIESSRAQGFNRCLPPHSAFAQPPFGDAILIEQRMAI